MQRKLQHWQHCSIYSNSPSPKGTNLCFYVEHLLPTAHILQSLSVTCKQSKGAKLHHCFRSRKSKKKSMAHKIVIQVFQKEKKKKLAMLWSNVWCNQRHIMDGHNDSLLEQWYSCASAIEFAELPKAGNTNSHTHTHSHTRTHACIAS